MNMEKRLLLQLQLMVPVQVNTVTLYHKLIKLSGKMYILQTSAYSSILLLRILSGMFFFDWVGRQIREGFKIKTLVHVIGALINRANAFYLFNCYCSLT